MGSNWTAWQLVYLKQKIHWKWIVFYIDPSNLAVLALIPGQENLTTSEFVWSGPTLMVWAVASRNFYTYALWPPPFPRKKIVITSQRILQRNIRTTARGAKRINDSNPLPHRTTHVNNPICVLWHWKGYCIVFVTFILKARPRGPCRLTTAQNTRYETCSTVQPNINSPTNIWFDFLLIFV